MMHWRILIGLAAAFSAAPAASAGSSQDAVRYYRSPNSTAPFSPAVRVGDVLYLSGMIGMGPDGKLPDGIDAQAKQAMENIGAVLKMAGGGYDDVFHCTVMLDKMSDWPAFNSVYITYFTPERLPARSAVGANGLALGALVEVECQAHVASGEAEK